MLVIKLQTNKILESQIQFIDKVFKKINFGKKVNVNIYFPSRNR